MNNYSFVPDTINLELALEKGLLTDGVLNDKYYYLRKVYYRGLQLLLDSVIGISKSEEMINNSELGFVSLDDKDTNVYHMDSDLNFIFIRNNIHIENLTLEEIEKILENQNNRIVILEIIKSTLNRVIFEKQGLINFGPVTSEYFCSGKSLVLEIAHNQKACETVDEIYKKQDFIEEIKKNLLENGKIKQIPVSVVINKGLFNLEKTASKKIVN